MARPSNRASDTVLWPSASIRFVAPPNAAKQLFTCPRIGLGQGGGTWELITEEVERALCRHGVAVTVYTHPGDHQSLVMSGGRPAS